MKARTEVLEAELRKKTDFEDRMKAAELGLKAMMTSVTSQFAANDKRCNFTRYFSVLVWSMLALAASFLPRKFLATVQCQWYLTPPHSPLVSGMSTLPKKPKSGLKNSARAKSTVKPPSTR